MAIRAVVGVHFDAGQRELAGEGFRAKSEEQARPATRLEDAPAVEAHPAECPPDGADHELRRVVGVLGGPLEVGEVVARDEPFEFDAEIFPGGRESVSGAAEDPVGEVGRAERGEARQPLLLVGPGMAGFRLDRRHKSDRGEIVLCARFPTLGKTALAGEPVVLRRKRWFGGNRRVEGFGLFGLDIDLRMGGGFRSWESAIKAEALRNDRGVEEGQGELVVFHGERS